MNNSDHISTRKAAEILDEAAELAMRFPDLPEYEVLEHINYVCRVNITENTIYSWGVMAAYNTQDAKAGFTWMK